MRGAGPHLPTQEYIEYPPPPRPRGKSPSSKDSIWQKILLQK